jgi:hypothetical protein
MTGSAVYAADRLKVKTEQTPDGEADLLQLRRGFEGRRNPDPHPRNRLSSHNHHYRAFESARLSD